MLEWPVSLKACNLHLINSVGHKVNEEKNAAKKPAKALSKTVNDLVLPIVELTFWSFGFK
jgi:hypothetical protein